MAKRGICRKSGRKLHSRGRRPDGRAPRGRAGLSRSCCLIRAQLFPLTAGPTDRQCPQACHWTPAGHPLATAAHSLLHKCPCGLTLVAGHPGPSAPVSLSLLTPPLPSHGRVRSNSYHKSPIPQVAVAQCSRFSPNEVITHTCPRTFPPRAVVLQVWSWTSGISAPGSLLEMQVLGPQPSRPTASENSGELLTRAKVEEPLTRVGT